jgi:AcrR family transcriptional regulator
MTSCTRSPIASGRRSLEIKVDRRHDAGAKIPGTRAGLTKPAIVEAAANLIESAGVNEFSLRKLAKAMGVGPTTIHFHFKRAGGGIYAAIVVRALAGVIRRLSRRRSPRFTSANCSSKSCRRCTVNQ